MTVSFPPSPSNGDTYLYNGTVFVFDGVKWVSGGATAYASSAQGELAETAVQRAGDNMTGDLTLGTDKITLDATGGDITMLGSQLKCGSYGSRTTVGVGANVFAGSKAATVFIKGEDASATAEALVVQNGSDPDNDVVLFLKYDGSADFAGNVTVADYDSTSTTARGSRIGNGSINVQRAADQPSANTQATFTSFLGNVSKARIFADGSAEYAAAVQIGNDPRNGTSAGTRLGTTTGLTATGDIGAQYVVSLYNQGVTGRTVGIQASGEATFANTVTCGPGDGVAVDGKGAGVFYRATSITTNNVFVAQSDVGGTQSTAAFITAAGEATFTGNVIAGVFDNNKIGVRLSSGGSVSSIRGGLYNNAFSVRVEDDSAPRGVLTAGGSLFLGDLTNISNASASGNIALKGEDGSASFAGDVSVGNDSTLTINNPDGTRTLKLSNGSNFAEIKADIDPIRLNAEHVNGYIRFDTSGGNERMRLDNSGRLGVGLTPSSSGATTDISAGLIQTDGNIDIRYSGTSVEPGGARYLNIVNTDTTVVADQIMGGIQWIGNDSSNPQSETASIRGYSSGNTGSASELAFRIAQTERMRLDSSGGIYHNSSNQGIGTFLTQNAGETKYAFRAHNSSPVGSYGGTISFTVWSNGNVDNTNNSYGAISDITLKENIVPASDQWANIKGIEIVNYNFKEETGHQTHKQLGVIAQQVEEVSPGLVKTNEEGLKSVNYSILYMKSVKALQEAMARIETLEASNADLLARVAALEAS